MTDLHVYDTTLRDGAQQEGLNLSVSDKLAIAAHLDELGVGFIEGGWPGANPKDTEFFARAQKELSLRNATLAAFGATRRAGGTAADDPLVRALVDSGASVVTLVAKSHAGHVERALRTTLAENLAMIRDTVGFLRCRGPARLPRRRALLRRVCREPRLRARGRACGRRVRRGGRGALRHQRRHAAASGGRCRGRRARRHVRAAGHPLPQRHRVRRGQLAGCGRRGRHARPGHGQRVRRAHRERRPADRRQQPADQAGPAACWSRRGCARRRGSPTRSARSPTCPRTAASPTSGPARSRTRPVCTPAPSRSTPTCTSTPTPCSSATTCGCWSPTWPDAPASSSRAGSSASTSAATTSC